VIYYNLLSVATSTAESEYYGVNVVCKASGYINILNELNINNKFFITIDIDNKAAKIQTNRINQ